MLLFKITLLQTWYGLSDCEVEDQVRDRISFSRFRTALTKANAYDKLLKEINQQLQNNNILVTTGVIVEPLSLILSENLVVRKSI